MLVLIHSPLAGPLTWQRVAHELQTEGLEVSVPALHDTEGSGLAYWQQHAAAIQQALSAVSTDQRLILVAHSGAGPLLPVIRQQLSHPVAAYVFADAGIPQAGASRLDLIAAESADWVQSFHAFLVAGGRFPDWRDEDLAEEIPNEQLRARLLNELQPRALPFWTEPIPVFAGWPDAPCAYVQFSPAYDVPAAHARDRGWLYRHLPGGHFMPLVDPQAVARTLSSMLRDLGIDQTDLNKA
jgi:pimeloyl-ACP methyl ester carboxylesterase